MRNQTKFSKRRPDGRRYLLLLNDTESFAREAGVTDDDVAAVLRSHAAKVRILAARHREIATQSRKMLQLYRQGEYDADAPRGLDAATQRGVDAELQDWGPRDQSRMLLGFAKLAEMAHIMRQTATNLTIRRSREAREKLVEILTRLHIGPTGRIAICRLCDRAFYWSPKRRAQRFCTRCRRRWSPQQLWYRATHKGQPVRERRKPSATGGART